MFLFSIGSSPKRLQEVGPKKNKSSEFHVLSHLYWVYWGGCTMVILTNKIHILIYGKPTSETIWAKSLIINHYLRMGYPASWGHRPWRGEIAGLLPKDAFLELVSEKRICHSCMLYHSNVFNLDSWRYWMDKCEKCHVICPQKKHPPLRIIGTSRTAGLTVYSRVLGSPNHQF